MAIRIAMLVIFIEFFIGVHGMFFVLVPNKPQQPATSNAATSTPTIAATAGTHPVDESPGLVESPGTTPLVPGTSPSDFFTLSTWEPKNEEPLVKLSYSSETQQSTESADTAGSVGSFPESSTLPGAQEPSPSGHFFGHGLVVTLFSMLSCLIGCIAGATVAIFCSRKVALCQPPGTSPYFRRQQELECIRCNA